MNWKRLIGWPWFVKAGKREMETGWENDPWFRDGVNYRLFALANRRAELIEELKRAKDRKKARKHIYAALEENTRERLRIEGGE